MAGLAWNANIMPLGEQEQEQLVPPIVGLVSGGGGRGAVGAVGSVTTGSNSASGLRVVWPIDDQRWMYAPALVACLSFVVLLLWRVVLRVGSKRRADFAGRREVALPGRRSIVERSGGKKVFAFMLARVVGCAALVGLSVPAVLDDALREGGGPRLRSLGGLVVPNPYWSLLLVNVYALVLAIAALLTETPDWRALLVRINIVCLLSELGVYAARDVWPLAVYGGGPVDLELEGSKVLWAKVAVLAFTAIAIPLWIPQPYHTRLPLEDDGKAGQMVPERGSAREPERLHPEEVASVWSSYTYGYLTPTIGAAQRKRHLGVEELPPMAGYDRAVVVRKRVLPYLDPYRIRRSRHIWWGLLRIFGADVFWGVVAMSVHAASQFTTPLAINKLLAQLESDDTRRTPLPGDIKLWFWLLLLLVSPILGSVGLHASVRTMNRAFVLIESVLTQLVFEHSLRIRVKPDSDLGVGKASGRHGAESSSGDSATLVPSAEEEEGEGEPENRAEEPAKKSSDTSSFIGKLNNLVTVDLANISMARDFLLLVWLLPIKIIGCTVFLYFLLGWSAFVGLATMTVLTLTLPGYLTAKLQGFEAEKLKATDRRTSTVVEAMNVLRMIKMFGWERKIQEKIDERREVELGWVWKTKFFYIAISAITEAIPTFAMLASYATLTLVMKAELTASMVFSSMILFDTMKNELARCNMVLSAAISGKVSLDRFDAFFKETEFLDRYAHPEETPNSHNLLLSGDSDEYIGFRNASFTWSPDASPTQFKLTVPGKLEFAKGKINLIVGPTGSGKTSLLMALLGEMHFIPMQGHPDSGFNLPREGGVSFAVQESWVENATVKENVLFGAKYDEQRYRKVLKQCALEKDLELFEAGDETEIGERGLTLSGGQKARITLARAIYANSNIILLDDVLAALDVHTAKWIVNNCLKGDLVHGRTVLLVTHNVALAGPIADFIVTVNADGVVSSRTQDISEIIRAEPALQAEAEEELTDESDALEKPTEEATIKSGGKLIIAEEVQEGNVSWKAMRILLKSMGGNHVTLFFTLWFMGPISQYLLISLSTWFLGDWSSQFEKMPAREVPNVWYMNVYAGIMLATVVIFYCRDLWFVNGTMRASRQIHKMLSQSILGTTLRWLDETPVSRTITRMTQDIRSIDGVLMWYLEGLASQSIQMVIDLVSAVLFVPVFSIPGLLIACVGMYMGSKYLKAQLSVKRETSNAKAPMVAHFGAAIAGLVSIRAYGAESMFKKESQKRIDHYVRLSRLNLDLNRWIAVRIDSLGAFFTASLATYLAYSNTVSAANVGFSLNRSVSFCFMILYVVRLFNMAQVEANSMERIASYLEIEQEEKPTEEGRPPAAWPTSGDVRVEKLTARYSKNGPAVLHDLTFHLPSGSRVGVVGRTGSGKSSLTLALLRCIITEGTVYLDGLPTDKVNLDVLRSKITIIPQLPELLNGTLRSNLDPFDEYDDATLNAALRASGLYASSNASGGGRLQLDSVIASGGANVSVGQRQIIALARAMIRSSKLLILDEATSAIDHETDAIIQNTLRQELGSGVTVLTIAHRLQTIVDADTIMVLEAGRIVEFAPPKELLSRQDSLFKSLVDESADKAKIYEIAGLSPESQVE